MASRDGRSTYCTMSARSTKALSMREEGSSEFNDNPNKTKSDTDGFHEIACGHNQNVLAVFEFVELGEQGIDNLRLFQRI
jgi:hypothetical protein